MIVNFPLPVSGKVAVVGLISLAIASIGVLKSGLPQLLNSFLNDGLTIKRQENQEKKQAKLVLVLLKDEINENMSLLQRILKVLGESSEGKKEESVDWYQRAWEKYSSALDLAINYEFITLSQFKELQNFYRGLGVIAQKHSELVSLQSRFRSFKEPAQVECVRQDMRILLEEQEKLKAKYQQKPGQSKQEFLESLLVANESTIALNAHKILNLYWEPKIRAELKQLTQNLLDSGNPIA